MMIIEKPEELIALSKALRHVKFESNDYEARYLAASPIIANLYKKIYDSLVPYYKQQGVNILEQWPNIATLPEYVEAIKEHIKNIDTWNELSINTKSDLITVFSSPYLCNDDLIVELIDYGNNIHSSTQ